MKAPLFSDPELELRSPLPLPLLLVRPSGFQKEIWLRVKDALTDTFSNCPPGTEASRHLLWGHFTRWEHAVQEQKVHGVAEEPGELAAERGSDLLPSPCTEPQQRPSCESRSRKCEALHCQSRPRVWEWRRGDGQKFELGSGAALWWLNVPCGGEEWQDCSLGSACAGGRTELEHPHL